MQLINLQSLLQNFQFDLWHSHYGFKVLLSVK